MRDSPVAYLLEPDELNQDPTNYWIFSEAGLKRLLRRTGWEICSYQTLGDIQASTPATLEHDERAFCVLRSRLRTDPSANARLLEGWYKVEEDHWRWTARVFSVECAAPAHGAGAVLELRFLYPERLYQRTASLEIKTSLAGLPLGTQQFSRPGEHLYQAAVPAAMLRESFVPITFELSHAIPPDGTDLAERSIIVLNVGLL